MIGWLMVRAVFGKEKGKEDSRFREKKLEEK